MLRIWLLVLIIVFFKSVEVSDLFNLTHVVVFFTSPPPPPPSRVHEVNTLLSPD